MGTSGIVFSTIRRATSPDRIKDMYLCLYGASPRKDLNATGSHWFDLRNMSDLHSLFLMRPVPSPLMTQIHYLGQPLFALGCADASLYQLHSPLFHPHDAPHSIFRLASFFFIDDRFLFYRMYCFAYCSVDIVFVIGSNKLYYTSSWPYRQDSKPTSPDPTGSGSWIAWPTRD
jgi:hypothetical protein